MNKLLQKVKENLNLKVILGFVVMTVIFMVGRSVVYVNEIEPRREDVYTADVISGDKKGTMLPLKEGMTVTQTFVYPQDQMMAVGVELYSDAYKNKGEFSMKVYDMETNELLGEDTFDASQLTDMRAAAIDDVSYFNVGTPNDISGNENRYMRIEFSVVSLSEKSSVYLYANGNTKYNQAQVTGADTEDPLNIVVRGYCYHYGYWAEFFKWGTNVIYFMLAGCYILIMVFRAKPHQIFVIAGTCMALCYAFLLPPGTVPDEIGHIETTYYYSNKLLGIEEPDAESIYVRKTDQEAIGKLQTTPTLKEYNYFILNITHRSDDTKLVKIDATKGSDNWLLYAPAILGVTAGRLIGLNGITTLYAGRFFMMFVYLIFAFFAIKRVPVGKAAMFIIVLSPMFIQQSCSYSYDAMPIELTTLFVAELFSVLYEDRKIKKRDIIILSALAFVIASCKAGTYIPECLLLFLIPKEKYESEKQCRRMRIGFLVVMILGFLINSIPYLMMVLGITEATTELQQYSNSLNCYTVSDVLFNPGNTVRVLITTFLQYIDFYFEGSFAGPLGWLNIGINPMWGYLMAGLMLLGLTAVKDEPEYITKKQRVWIALALLATVAMVTAAMFVSWTGKGSTTISGIQGRYFTPILFYFFFLFRGKFIKIAHNVDNAIMYFGIALNVIVISNILSSTQTVM
ncbi:DUF2142 domain-containing protein [Roseburia sp. BX0805]|uniref:DUF2142 domain-containing protein n=1 Tax=Roseburia yibonii TaxID=2763063 RepID=A0ABR7I7P5_9FIRM|nr:DUF2142 domain-containing protein [Roseburia yibonii]MBC5752809.1 DUF2142 domain-containing protein [Roseburia yibonii]